MKGKERAVWLLGAAQCAYWGILYYGFAVLLLPMREELGLSETLLAGAFSVGLGVWALCGPAAGARVDRGQGPLLLGGGALAAAALLLLWSLVEAAWQLYLVWAGLGATMAAILYETAFGVVIRAFDDLRERLNALARITVLGGLASTLFVPLAAWGAETAGWRATLRAAALVVLVMAILLQMRAMGSLAEPATTREGPMIPPPPAAPSPLALPSATPTRVTEPGNWSLVRLAGPFVASTFAATGLGALAIPALVGRGHSLAEASSVVAVFGISQLPGRLWMSLGKASPRTLLVAPLVVQMAGYLALGLLPSLAGAAAGIALVGLGGGLHTLARPWVVPHLYGTAAAGRINGLIAGAQGLARAAGPVAALAAATRAGAAAVFLTLALLVALTFPWALRSALAAGAASGRG